MRMTYYYCMWCMWWTGTLSLHSDAQSRSRHTLQTANTNCTEHCLNEQATAVSLNLHLLIEITTRVSLFPWLMLIITVFHWLLIFSFWNKQFFSKPWWENQSFYYICRKYNYTACIMSWETNERRKYSSLIDLLSSWILIQGLMLDFVSHLPCP